jgi:hypothetical protein
MDKNFKNFSINDFISSKIDKKINKKSNIKKIYSDFYTNLKKITKRYPYGYIKKLH